MKKLLTIGVIFLGVIFLTGCGGKNTYTCTAKVTENGVTYTGKVIATLDSDDKVKTVDLEMIFEDEDAAKQTYAIYEWANSMTENEEDKVDISRNGKTISIKNVEKTSSSDEENVNYVGLTKEEFKKVAEESSEGVTYECK